MWTTETVEAIIHLLGAISWGLALLVLLLTPGLLGLIATSYTHSRTERISSYITRFVPTPIFTACIYLISTLCLGVIALKMGLRLGYWADNDLQQLGTYGAWLAGGGLALGLYYRFTYRLWSYLYMPREAAAYLRQDYFIISTLRAGCLLALSLVVVMPIPTHIFLWVLGIVLVVVQLLRGLQAIRRLWHGSKGHFYIFLYLCAHELLPWLCAAQLVDYWI